MTSDFGRVSSIFDKEHETVLTLAKDYLYSQGYFETLATLADDFAVSDGEQIVQRSPAASVKRKETVRITDKSVKQENR